MAWIQLKVITNNTDAETIANSLSDLGAIAVTFQDNSDTPIYEPPINTTPLWKKSLITGLFESNTDINNIKDRLAKAHGNKSKFNCTIDYLKDQDWVRHSLNDFRPQKFGSSLWVIPSWCKPPETKNAVHVQLDPGLAFGTGLHPTTALCLQWLDSHPPKNLTVIDYGCGSGILAIAAAKLGAAHVWAVDHDPQAIQSTTSNVEKNQLIHRISIIEPHQLHTIEVDLLIANILLNPLTELADQFNKLVKQDGHLVLSGLLSTQSECINMSYKKWFNSQTTYEKKGWICVDGLKRSIANN